jgi:hypothetical protein
MKKRLNIMFFGICFLAAILAEAYCLLWLEGNLFSLVGISMIVLINGYLLMDAIKSSIKHHIEHVKFYTDHVLREETERWNERYNELINLQKATYSATKKNTVVMSEQMKDILLKLEAADHRKELQRMIELLKKSLEGQKNALNMELHYNKEYTKQLLEAIREESSKTELTKQLSDILKLLEDNNKLLGSGIVTLDSIKQIQDLEPESYAKEKAKKDYFVEDEYDSEQEAAAEEDFKLPDGPEQESGAAYESISESDDKGNQGDAVTFEKESPEFQDNEKEPGLSPFYSEKPEQEIKVKPLYSDPNKNLSADEIASLFASLG